jgi:hypothetical protein
VLVSLLPDCYQKKWREACHCRPFHFPHSSLHTHKSSRAPDEPPERYYTALAPVHTRFTHELQRQKKSGWKIKQEALICTINKDVNAAMCLHSLQGCFSWIRNLGWRSPTGFFLREMVPQCCLQYLLMYLELCIRCVTGLRRALDDGLCNNYSHEENTSKLNTDNRLLIFTTV